MNKLALEGETMNYILEKRLKSDPRHFEWTNIRYCRWAWKARVLVFLYKLGDPNVIDYRWRAL